MKSWNDYLDTFFPYAINYSEHGEDLYILHYEVGKKFEPHHDYYEDDDTKNGSQRIATVLMYLYEPALPFIFYEMNGHCNWYCHKSLLSLVFPCSYFF